MATTIKVVDASALACVCFDEADIAAVTEAFYNSTLFAPAILEFEMGNICWKRLRRHPGQSAAILQQFGSRKEFAITFRDVVMDEVVPLAAETGLTAYDASYLWLARTLRAPLVTLDQKLTRVAARILN